MGHNAKRRQEAWALASDVGRAGLAIAAVGAPAGERDWRGGRDAIASVLAAHGIGTLLKDLIPEERPDDSNQKSFPSTHSAVTFASAASLTRRYGWSIGLPAVAAASGVAIARVLARRHHWYDALAGAAIGTTCGVALTSHESRSTYEGAAAPSSVEAASIKASRS